MYCENPSITTSEKELQEINVAKYLLELTARLPSLANIEKRLPPEPDILCNFSNGERVAFELVEICNPDNARFILGSGKIFNAIIKTIEESPQIKQGLWKRFETQPLSFEFFRNAGTNAIRGAMPEILAQLIDMENDYGTFHSFSAPIPAGIIRKVSFAGKVNCIDDFNINLQWYFDFTDNTIETVIKKTSKNYVSDYPIELIAFFGSFAIGKNTSYHTELAHKLKIKGKGPFRKIWVIERDRIGFEFP